MAISAQHTKFVYPDYVSALPADIYISGMDRKQQQYDLGRQQLQNKLDIYGQIKSEFIKPEDMEYFDSEMSNMLNEINKNAGLDFSVKSNVNAVMNIGKPLENNNVLKNALSSSRKYKELMTQFQSIDPKDRGAANDYFFMKNINSWLQDGKAGSQLQADPYTPYGIDKKVYGQLMKDLKPITETYTTIDESGRYIQKQVISGVSAARFEQAYLSTIGESGVRQLQMDAQYQLETRGKGAITNQYLQDQALYADGISKELTSLQQKQEAALAKEGSTGPNVLMIKEKIADLSKKQNLILSRLSQDPSTIDDSTLVRHIISENLRDTSGSYAYQSVDEELKEEPYALEQYKTSLNIYEYQQKENLDLLYDTERQRLGITSRKSGKQELQNPPAGAQETSAALLKDTPVIYESDTLINAVRTPEKWNSFVAGFAKHIGDFDYTIDPNTGKVNVVGEGKKNVQQALEKIADENNWDQKEYLEVSRSLGGGAIAENFYWKMKGLGSKLGLNMPRYSEDGLSSKIKDAEGTEKNVTSNSTIIVNYSVPGFKPFSRKFKVNDFLKVPASELLFVQSVNVDPETAEKQN